MLLDMFKNNNFFINKSSNYNPYLAQFGEKGSILITCRYLNTYNTNTMIDPLDSLAKNRTIESFHSMVRRLESDNSSTPPNHHSKASPHFALDDSPSHQIHLFPTLRDSQF